jgi:Holliday junction resolvase
MDSKHKSSHSELIACSWLLKRGYDVFRNVSHYGIADIVAFRGDDIIKIDVKSAGNAAQRVPLKETQLQAGCNSSLCFP